MSKKRLLAAGFAILAVLLIIGGVYRTRERLATTAVQGEANANNENEDQVPQARWETAVATVTAIRSNGLWLELEDGTQARARRAAWGYAREQGFSAEVGDLLTLTGYRTSGGFEITTMVNEENGQEVALRDENGRSLWAGRGDE